MKVFFLSLIKTSQAIQKNASEMRHSTNTVLIISESFLMGYTIVPKVSTLRQPETIRDLNCVIFGSTLVCTHAAPLVCLSPPSTPF